MDLFELANTTLTLANEFAPAIGAATGLGGGTLALLNLWNIRRDSKLRTRPYVYAEAVPGLHGLGYWDLRIVNSGASQATEVRLEMNKWEPTDVEDHITKPLQAALRHPFYLPPGQSVRLMWRLDLKRPNRHSLAGAAAVTEVTVCYRGDVDRKSRTEGYRETFTVSTVHNELMPAPADGERATEGPDRNERNIAYAIRALAQHVGELRR